MGPCVLDIAVTKYAIRIWISIRPKRGVFLHFPYIAQCRILLIVLSVLQIQLGLSKYYWMLYVVCSHR